MDLSPLLLLLGIKIINSIWYTKYYKTKYFLEPPSEHDINDAREFFDIDNKKIDNTNVVFKPYLINYRFYC